MLPSVEVFRLVNRGQAAFDQELAFMRSGIFQ